jgi:hypothetical protein
MKFKSFLIPLLGVSLCAHAQNTAKTSVTNNIVDQGSRGITAAKISVTLNQIIDWVGNPNLKRVTISQLRAITTDWPAVLQVIDANGLFTLDATDVSSSDDGVNTLVTTSGLKRYKRVILSIATVTGLQTALDLKAPLASPVFSGTVTVPNISANGATISATELSYIDNLSSNAQTQISAKLPLSGGTLTGGLTGTSATFSGKGLFADTVRSDVGVKGKKIFLYNRKDASNDDLFTFDLADNGTGAGQSLNLSYVSSRTSGGLFGNNILYITDGRVGLGTNSIASSSILDVRSTTKGLLIPRLTQAQRTAISSPAEGLMVYQTDGIVGLWIYQNSTWVRAFTSTDNTIAGSSITGTSLRVPFFSGSGVLTTNNDVAYNTANNHFGIGYSSPDSKLAVFNFNGGALLKIGYNDTEQNYVNGVTTFRNVSNVRKFEVNESASVAYTDTFRVKNIRLWHGAGGVSSNISIGNALTANTTGYDNIAIGYNTLNGNTFAIYNIGLGSYALAGANSDNNVAIGYNSLSQGLSGTNNIALGVDAGRLGPASGSNNMYLGYSGTNVSGSNNIAIGTYSTLRYFSNSSGTQIGGLTSPVSTNGGLDIASGGLSLVVGADNNSGLRTNSTTKMARVGAVHYTNSEEPVALVMSNSNSTSSVVSYGFGSTAMNAATQLRFGTGANNTTTSGTEWMRLDSLGRLGIGTTAPTSRLHLNGSGVQTARVQSTDNGAQLILAGTYGGVVASGGSLSLTTNLANPVYLQTNSLTRATVSATGNFGVGTTSPASLVEVVQPTTGEGTVSNSAGGTTVTGVGTEFLNTFKVGDNVTIGGQTVAISAIANNTSMTTAAITNANTNATYTLTGGSRLVVKGNGRVGIGTTSPTSNLHVTGLPTFADNSAALAGGLTAGAFYRTSTGQLMVTY